MKHVREESLQFEITELRRNVDRWTSLYGGQINLTCPDDGDGEWITNSVGKLYDPRTGEPLGTESVFTRVIPQFKDSFFNHVYDLTAHHIKSVYLRPTRVRIMTLEPKTCLTYHSDPGNGIRYHIPIYTTPGAMFVHGDTVSRMSKPGCLYMFDASTQHTAINASNEKRVHIVFSTTLVSPYNQKQ